MCHTLTHTRAVLTYHPHPSLSSHSHTLAGLLFHYLAQPVKPPYASWGNTLSPLTFVKTPHSTKLNILFNLPMKDMQPTVDRQYDNPAGLQ